MDIYFSVFLEHIIKKKIFSKRKYIFFSLTVKKRFCIKLRILEKYIIHFFSITGQRIDKLQSLLFIINLKLLSLQQSHISILNSSKFK